MSDTREDGFLGGRLRIRQPARGYRSGADAVMLAAACPAAPGQRVLELGCGAGVASLCLGWR
ncbi:methyltransferase, partial [Paracoccus siganidrum]